MAVVALTSAKGSPGVTTAALGLAARWPGPAILVEADPAGGDLAPRFGAHRSPGLAEWAADSRLATPAGIGSSYVPVPAMNREVSQPDIGRYVQRLPGIGAGVVFGASAEQMPAAVSLLVGSGGLTGPPRGLAAAPRAEAGLGGGGSGLEPDLLLDLGRLDFSSDVLRLVPDALVLLVARGWPDSVAAVLSRREVLLRELGMLGSPDGPDGPDGPDTAIRPARVGLLLVGDSPYSRVEIQAVAGLPVRDVLPWDERGADVLSGRRGPGKAWTRSPLLRACRSLAAGLYAGLHPERRPDHPHPGHSPDVHSAGEIEDGPPKRTGRGARWAV